MSSYAATAQGIMAMPKPDTRHADLVRRSDVLLHRLEKLNLDAYRPYRPEQPPVGGVRTAPRFDTAETPRMRPDGYPSTDFLTKPIAG